MPAKSTTTDRESRLLPPGYTDQDSPYFIPEPLRPHYPAAVQFAGAAGPTTRSGAEHAAHLLAARDLLKEGAASSDDLDRVSRWAEYKERTTTPPARGSFRAPAPEHLNPLEGSKMTPGAADELLRAWNDLAADYLENPDELSRVQTHHLRLDHAQATETRRLEAIRDREKAMRANTCPVCGIHDPSRIGAPRLVPLIPAELSYGPPGIKVKACAACALVIRDELAASVAAELTPSGASRLDLVRKAMASTAQ